MKGLSLVIPCHNGAFFIQESLLKYHQAFSKKFKKLEIIVVCNACTDNTEEKCNNLKTKIPLIVLNVPERGKGNALIRGFNQAKYEIIGFLDADDPFDLNDILNMVNFLDRADLVIVTKFKKGRLKLQSSTLRRIFSLGDSFVSRFLFGLKFSDTQAGAKFMKKEVWNKLNKDFVSKGFEFDIELLYKLKKINSRIIEYYLPPKKSEFSTVKMRILPGIIYRLLKLRIKK